MQTLVIPDIHNKVEKAQQIVDRHKNEADEIVFLGDYFDNYDDTPKDAEKTARYVKSWIDIGYKLLWGNHDFPYFFPFEPFMCPGFSVRKMEAIRKVMSQSYRNDFQIFHHSNGFLFSHAGASVWHGHTMSDMVSVEHLKNLEFEALSTAAAGLSHTLFLAGFGRGGSARHPGPLWADWVEFSPPEGISQIVGHTPARKTRTKKVGSSDMALCLDTGLNHYAIVTDGCVKILETGGMEWN